jgi:serine protease
MNILRTLLGTVLLLCISAFARAGEFIPNDPLFPEQWGLKNTDFGFDIGATKAWHLERGKKNIAIVIIDTGIDYTHPDLINNIWTNPGEIADNGIDDDGNGYIDDMHGINAITGSGDPMDDNGHGTMQAGVIGAEGNNGIGVAGVLHNVSLIACKFLDKNGGGSTRDAIKCLDYVADLAKRDIGVTIIATNNAWGSGSFNELELNAIHRHRDLGILFVATSGGDATNLDNNKVYPASYESSNIIVVAKADREGNITYFSSYGPNTVHIAAPGQDILTTYINNSYEKVSGTAALGFVSGIIGLLKSHNENLGAVEIKQKILKGVIKLRTTEDQSKIITGGFANAFIALTN